MRICYDAPEMLDWMNIDLPSLVLGAVLSALASTWYGYFVKRPKLRVTGGGGGGSASTVFHGITNVTARLPTT